MLTAVGSELLGQSARHCLFRSSEHLCSNCNLAEWLKMGVTIHLHFVVSWDSPLYDLANFVSCFASGYTHPKLSPPTSIESCQASWGAKKPPHLTWDKNIRGWIGSQLCTRARTPCCSVAMISSWVSLLLFWRGTSYWIRRSASCHTSSPVSLIIALGSVLFRWKRVVVISSTHQ